MVTMALFISGAQVFSELVVGFIFGALAGATSQRHWR
jgi:hypothetical protein